MKVAQWNQSNKRHTRGIGYYIWRLFTLLVLLLILLPLGILGWDSWISWNTRNDHTAWINEVEPTDNALLLGTAQVAWGMENPYFWHRIDAAEALYRSGKVKRFLLSGDGETGNETDAMHQALKNRGIPDKAMLLDPKGYRTLDSIVRAKTIYQWDHFIVISQQFHNERAIYTAKLYGLNNIRGFNADDMMPGRYKDEVDHREYFARAKLLLDFITGMRVTDPTP